MGIRFNGRWAIMCLWFSIDNSPRYQTVVVNLKCSPSKNWSSDFDCHASVLKSRQNSDCACCKSRIYYVYFVSTGNGDNWVDESRRIQRVSEAVPQYYLRSTSYWGSARGKRCGLAITWLNVMDLTNVSLAKTLHRFIVNRMWIALFSF